MITEIFEFAGHGGNVLPGILWLPEDRPKMLVQITHGMTEHMGRYDTLARALTAQRIAVAGFDLRGHGKNPGDACVASLGEGGWEASLDDMHALFVLLKDRFPGLPHVMLGFSLGAILQREYLQRYPQDADAAVLMGVGDQPKPVLALARAIAKQEIKKAGFDATTPRIQSLSFGAYNKKFAPNRTRMDWLCADKAQLDAYLADPLCRENVSAGLFDMLLGGMLGSGRPKRTGSGWRRQIPVLLISGEEDTVGNGGKSVRRIADFMRRSGMLEVTLKLVAGARHDILHEEESGAAKEARDYIADWMVKAVCL